MTTCAYAVAGLIAGAGLFSQDAAAQSRTSQLLLADLQNARAVLCVAAHPDDDIFVPGLLALASLRFNKDTCVISRSHNPSPPVGFPPGATVRMRFQDNAEIEEFLRLKRYIRFDPSEHPGAGDRKEKFRRFLRQFILENNVDVVVSFEPEAGFNGHPDHKELAGQIRRLLRDIVENEKRKLTLYCIINGNSELHWMREHGPPLEPPHTDLIDLDAERVSVPGGRSMTLWELYYEVFGIYKDSVGGVPAIYKNWEAWSSKVHHEELYQRVAWR